LGVAIVALARYDESWRKHYEQDRQGANHNSTVVGIEVGQEKDSEASTTETARHVEGPA